VRKHQREKTQHKTRQNLDRGDPFISPRKTVGFAPVALNIAPIWRDPGNRSARLVVYWSADEEPEVGLPRDDGSR